MIERCSLCGKPKGHLRLGGCVCTKTAAGTLPPKRIEHTFVIRLERARKCARCSGIIPPYRKRVKDKEVIRELTARDFCSLNCEIEFVGRKVAIERNAKEIFDEWRKDERPRSKSEKAVRRSASLKLKRLELKDKLLTQALLEKRPYREIFKEYKARMQRPAIEKNEPRA